ncbi:MAG: Ig-like domain-containing protein [Saprospiraceae bacterium]
MFRTCLLFLPLSLFLFGLIACASPRSPTGGAKDVKPPAIVEEQSTPNKQTNFHEKQITIVFDEWIILKDIYTQLVVSPLMPHDPDIKQKGKGLVIKLPDSLRANTTYTINFGNAIADLNENNVLENYAFVFSTGNELDSVRLTGNVINAFTLKPADGVWVMLYQVGEDSAIYKHKPEYVAKTNKEGKWIMSNLRRDSFELVALKDDNQNFLYDQEGELIGWREEVIHTDNPEIKIPEIKVFPRENRNRINQIINVAPGWLKVVIDAPHPKPKPLFLPELTENISTWDGDTLQIWYDPAKNYAGYAVMNDDSTLIRASQTKSLLSLPATVRLTAGRLRPGAHAIFLSATPIMVFDTSKISLQLDSLGNIPFIIEKNQIDPRKFELSAGWVEQKRYNLTFLPGAITDYWGRINDTIRESLVVTGTDQYGDLTMTIDGMDSTKQYLLLIKEGEQIRDTFVIEHHSMIHLTKKGLAPGKYNIEMIEDLNQNGVWDTGNYYVRRQPERKMMFIPDNLRAGWELEVKMTWISS